MMVEAEGWEFLSVIGSAYAALRASKDGEDERLAALVWRHMPFAKAVVDLAVRNAEQFEGLLKQHREAHMPFGEPPVAAEPASDGWAMKTYAQAQDAPSAQLQQACSGLHDGESYFTNVMALGTYDAINLSTGERRTQVAVAAKISKERPDAVAALAHRLREVVADLDQLAVVAGQPAS